MSDRLLVECQGCGDAILGYVPGESCPGCGTVVVDG